MKETMLKRVALTILLVVQVLGGGAVTLAHARDVVVAQAGVEANHTARCAILHNELRCALCHFMTTRVVTQHVVIIETPVAGARLTPPQPVVSVPPIVRLTPARAPRAPPPVLS